MNAPLVVAEKIAAAAAIGLLIGLEREWAHKEAGVRSFAIAALLGTVAWLIAPSLAIAEVLVVVVIIVLVNIFKMRSGETLEETTSLALAVTNVLGIVVGTGNFFAAFACAILIAALLSWKTEFIEFTSKLSVSEIRGTLLMAFITAVVYPLLPNSYIDPWHIINPRAIWLTVIIVSALNFVNYVLLRQFGMKGMRYSAILGGLVNSAATSILLGQELKNSEDFATALPSDFMLADLAMIFRNGALVVIFSLAAGIQASLDTLIALGPMVLAAAIISLINLLLSRRKAQELSEKPPLKSPLALRSVLQFGLLFFLLTVFGGVAQRFLGAFGFLIVVVVGALASAAASAVLIGGHVSSHMIQAQAAAIAIYLATVAGLVENVVILYSVARDHKLCIRLGLYSLLIILVGGAATTLLVVLGL
jgi:uncharacterized membrane protein (DUF4010 family)